MMFSEKYPHMRPIVDEKNNIMRGDPAPCSICGRWTEYIEINYEAHFCSEECLRKMDELSKDNG